MDCPLIDFSSPENKRESSILIPKSIAVAAPVLTNTSPFLVSLEENNPFDSVVCQVAANTAAENDPFEIVLNDAINHKEIAVDKCPNKVKDNEVKTNLSENKEFNSNRYSDEVDNTFLNLEDIPPPELFHDFDLNETCLLDESSLTSSQFLPPKVPLNSCKVFGTHEVLPASLALENLHSGEKNRSEEELRLSAQKMIENLISKAELKAHSDKQCTIAEKRRSNCVSFDDFKIDCQPNPSVEFNQFMQQHEESSCKDQLQLSPNFVNFTAYPDNPSSDVFENLTTNNDHVASRGLFEKINQLQEQQELSSSSPNLAKDFSTHFDEWSQNEMNKLNLSLGEFSAFSNSFDSTTLDQIVKPTSSQQVVRRRSKSSEPAIRMRSPSSPPQCHTPVLLTLPLCEDAVKNLNLCSKFSPDLSNAPKPGDPGKGGSSSTTVSDVKGKKHETKLMIRKPTTQSRTQSKTAPMKATAPVQNMTRVKSSPFPSARRFTDGNTTALVPEKSLPKEEATKSTRTPNIRASLKMVEPVHHTSGPLKNLPVKGNKLPTRLPSPQRPSAPEALYLKKRSSSIGASPRFGQRNSPCPKSGSTGRALSDVNLCSNTPKRSPKRRIHQLEFPRRSRSLLTEKENLPK